MSSPNLHGVERAEHLELGPAPPGPLPAADPDVEVLGVLADHDEVDLGRALVRERGRHAGQELDRPEVHVLVEVEPEREQDPLLEDARLHPVVADRAEVDGRELREFGEVVLGQELAGLEVAVRADRELGEVQVEAVPLAGGLEDAAALLHDLGADPVPADHRDFVLHVSTSPSVFAYSTSPPASAIRWRNSGTGSSG